MRTHQVSADNPRWTGPGIPTAKRLIKDMIKIGINITSGEMKAAQNRLIEVIANFYNFHLQRNQKRVFCPCCQWSGPSFIAQSNWRATTFNACCPQCGSASRHRGLFLILPELLKKKTIGDILVFAPEGVILDCIRSNDNSTIVTTDYNNPNVDFPKEDIQQLSFNDGSFSMIICNHVLEHVKDDQKALFECSRILTEGGIGLFTIPGDFQKHATWHFNKLDPNGHYRHYGMDVVTIMEKAFSDVQSIDLGLQFDQKFGVRPKDYLFICIK